MNADTPTVVAHAYSRGGACAGCGRPIRAGEEVVKLDTGSRGPQTSGGNGRGMWVGLGCCVVATPND